MTNLAHSGARLVGDPALSPPPMEDDRPQEIPSRDGRPFVRDQAHKMISAPMITNPFTKLVLLNGCANDVVIKLAMVKSEEVMTERSRRFCQGNLSSTIVDVAALFPNAYILVPDYYPYISVSPEGVLDSVGKTILNILSFPAHLAASIAEGVARKDWLQATGMKDIVDVTLQSPLAPASLATIAGLVDKAATAMRTDIQTAVQQANAKLGSLRSTKVVYSEDGFGTDNGAFGSHPWVYDTGISQKRNPLWSWRQQTCAKHVSWGSDDIMWERASTGHPNVVGACHYALGFLNALKDLNWCGSSTVAKLGSSGTNDCLSGLSRLPTCSRG